MRAPTRMEYGKMPIRRTQACIERASYVLIHEPSALVASLHVGFWP